MAVFFQTWCIALQFHTHHTNKYNCSCPPSPHQLETMSGAAAAAVADEYMLDADIAKQLTILRNPDAHDATTQARSLAVLTVLISRCSESNLGAVQDCLPALTQLAATGADKLVQANAVAALAASAALDDQLAAAVAAAASQPLAQLLQQCAGPDAAADFQLNVVAALGQLARDQQAAAEAMMAPQVLPCLLALADSSKPAKLQEAVADGLCALASHEWARPQLCEAGVVLSAAELLDVSQLETSVRCLMVLGMLLSGNTAAQQQLAGNAAALQQLLQLLKQQEDMDAKIIARDLIGLLMRDERLKGQIEAAIRQASSEQSAQQQQQEQQETA